jgi:hypothetical protein
MGWGILSTITVRTKGGEIINQMGGKSLVVVK